MPKIERCDTVPLPSITATRPSPEAISVGFPFRLAATAASCTICCPYTEYLEMLWLGELAEKRNGPASVTQQGACCVPEPVTVRTLPLRTRLIYTWRSLHHCASYPCGDGYEESD